jgi:PhnB protein
MSARLVPYLNFPGNAAEAMGYYQQIFGGTLTISTFGQFGVPGMPADGTMHAELAGDSLTLMASDAMAGVDQSWGDSRVYLAVMSDELTPVQGWFERLAADGELTQPLAAQVWGDLYGSVRDKYGLEWMFNIAASQQ